MHRWNVKDLLDREAEEYDLETFIERHLEKPVFASMERYNRQFNQKLGNKKVNEELSTLINGIDEYARKQTRNYSKKTQSMFALPFIRTNDRKSNL